MMVLLFSAKVNDGMKKVSGQGDRASGSSYPLPLVLRYRFRDGEGANDATGIPAAWRLERQPKAEKVRFDHMIERVTRVYIGQERGNLGS
jgi:hypothetical protein